MSEKLDNEEFRVVGLDNLEVIKGDANKLKLLITSYATIMEVQDAYIQKDLDEKKNKQRELEEKVASGNLEKNELKAAKKDLSLLKQEVRSLEDAYREFSEARQRFLALAKKALKLPKENFEQLAQDGWIKIEDENKKQEVIDLQTLAEAQEDVQSAITDEKDNDIFSSVDSNLIKEEVEKMMNRDITSSKNYGDTVARNIDADNFDETVSEIAEDIKNEVDERKANEVTPNHMKDLFTKQEEIKQEKPTSEPEQDEKSDTPDSPTIDFNIPSITGETGEWTTVQPPATNENKSFEGFDGDTSFKQFLTSRQEEIDRKSIEVNELESNVGELEKTADDKKAILEEETNKSKNAEADMALIEQQLEELKRLDEEEKRLSAQESELNEKQQKLNDEISEYDEKIGMIQQQNAAKLERYKAMQEEIKKYLGKYSDNYTTGEEERGLPRNVLR